MMSILKKGTAKKEDVKQVVSLPQEKRDIFIERPPVNPLFKLFFVFLKNLKLLIRSKISALIFIFGPLIIITLVALAFNTSTLYDLNIAAYSSSYSSLSDSILTNLSDSQYNVQKMNSQQECIDAVKTSDFHVCVIFPANMVLDNTAVNIVQIYVDNSRLNIAQLVSSQISTKVSVEASSLSSELVTEILTVLDSSNTGVVQTQSAIKESIEDNENIDSSVTSLSSNLNAIDFSYNSLDTSSLDSRLSSLKSDYNITDSDISSISSLVDSLESDYSSVTSRLDSSKASVGSVSSSTSSITSQLDAQKKDLEQASESLGGISEEIQGVHITNVASIVSPVKTTIEPISSINSYLLYILPTILVLLIMLVTLLMSSTSIVTEKASRAYFRNFITPTNDMLFMTGEFLSNFFILVFQTGIILGVLYYFFQTTFSWQTFTAIGVVLIVLGSFFIFLGMLFGYLFNTKQTVILAAISAAMIMLFFSNAILPLETLSSYTREIVQYNPFLLGSGMLKNILLFEATLQTLQEPLYLLLGFSFAVLVGAILARLLSKKYLTTD